MVLYGIVTLLEPLPDPDIFVVPVTVGAFARTRPDKFFKLADMAMALMRQTAGAATRISRTMTPAKYMLVKP
jgi:hypothetical protein